MKKKPLHVVVHAREPSVIELTLGDRVQLDRLTPAQDGCVTERHGGLLAPGVTSVALEPGHYFFKTLSDTNLRVVRGGVAAKIIANDKDAFPDSPASGPTPVVLGDDAPGELPRLSVEHA
jgi:hypothetical protein